MLPRVGSMENAIASIDFLQNDENIRYILQIPIVSTRGETSGVKKDSLPEHTIQLVAIGLPESRSRHSGPAPWESPEDRRHRPASNQQS